VAPARGLLVDPAVLDEPRLDARTRPLVQRGDGLDALPASYACSNCSSSADDHGACVARQRLSLAAASRAAERLGGRNNACARCTRAGVLDVVGARRGRVTVAETRVVAKDLMSAAVVWSIGISSGSAVAS
jgi:hypothetical protein